MTATATPVTKTVRIPLEVSPSITSKNDVPAKLQVALDTSTDITATLTDYITLVHVVTNVSIISTPTVAEKGPYYFTTDNGTTVWLGGQTPPAGVPLSTSTAVVTIQPVPPSSQNSSGGSPETTVYSTVFLTTISKVYETETITKTAPAVTTSSAVTISSFSPVLPSNTAPLSLIATRSSKSFPGLGLSGWNATFRIREKLVGSANEPAKLLSQQTGVQNNIATRPGTASLLAAPSYSSNATNHIRARQLGSIVVATIEGVVVSWTNNYDGAALKTPTPVAVTSDTASREDLVVTCEFHHELQDILRILIASQAAERYALPIYPWNLQPVPVQILPTSSPASSKTSSFEPPRSQARIPSPRSSVPTDFQNTLVLSRSGVQQPAPTKIITSVVPVLSVHPASSARAPRLSFSKSSSVSKSAVTATPSCTGRAKFTIDVRCVPLGLSATSYSPILSSLMIYHISQRTVAK